MMSNPVMTTRGGRMEHVRAPVDLDHAHQEATSLKRYANAEGKQDLAEFADMTLRLVAETLAARVVIEAARALEDEIAGEWAEVNAVRAAIAVYDRAARDDVRRT